MWYRCITFKTTIITFCHFHYLNHLFSIFLHYSIIKLCKIIPHCRGTLILFHNNTTRSRFRGGDNNICILLNRSWRGTGWHDYSSLFITKKNSINIHDVSWNILKLKIKYEKLKIFQRIITFTFMHMRYIIPSQRFTFVGST